MCCGAGGCGAEAAAEEFEQGHGAFIGEAKGVYKLSGVCFQHRDPGGGNGGCGAGTGFKYTGFAEEFAGLQARDLDPITDADGNRAVFDDVDG